MTTRSTAAAVSLVALAIVAGCQTSVPPATPIATQPRNGIEGEWIGTDGVAISTLQGGMFSSRFSETGEKLTEGTYKFRDARTIELNYYSLRSQQHVVAACSLINATQMNCTNSTGTQFVLVRRG